MGILDEVFKQKTVTEQQLSRGGSFSIIVWWKPESGENQIRIMPPWDAEGPFKSQFWRQVAQHWNVTPDQKAPVLCLKKTPGLEKPCPICEYEERLKDMKSNPEAQEEAKKIRAKNCYFLNVLDLKDPEHTAEDVANFAQSNPDRDCPFEVGQSKVKVYACPPTVFDSILGIMTANKEDITKLDTGRNITIKKIPNKDRRRTRYEVYPSLKATKVDLSDKYEFPALDQVGFQMDYDKMVNLLADGGADMRALGSGSQEEEALPKEESSSEDLEARMRAELSG